MAAKKKGKKNFGMARLGPLKLNDREKKWSERMKRSGMVRCTKPGCRVMVPSKKGRGKARCAEHQFKYPHGHGKLTAEDRHLLDLSKDEL